MEVQAKVRIFESWDGDPSIEAAIIDKAASQLVEKFSKEAQEQLIAKAEEAAYQAVETCVQNMLRNGIQMTDSYGNPNGKPKTVHEIMTGFLTKGSRGFGRTVLEEIVYNVLTQEFKKDIEECRKRFRKSLDDAVLGEFNKHIKSVLGVR